MVNDDPFYIADVSHCAKQYMKWNYYLPRVKTFYAVKTNSNSFIIRIIGEMGGGFDCASIEELNAVLSIYPEIDCSQRIIYSHPCKPISHISYFKDRNVQLTVADNINELIKIKEYWPNAKVLVRLKTNDSNSLIPLSTKFGANKHIAICLLDSAEKLEVNVVGCAFHVGTGCYDATAFRHALEFSRWFFDIANKSKHKLELKLLDIGGGFPGVDEEGKPTFSELARTINQTLNEFFPESTGRIVIYLSVVISSTVFRCSDNS
jgi:ornithine decarboxylase